MIGPGRVAQPNRSIGAGTEDEAGGDAERARTAWCLQCDEAILRRGIAEHERLHGRIVRGIARRTDVGLAVLRLEQHLFRRFYGIQYRGPAFRITIDTDPEIDLLGPRIVAELGDEAEDGVRRDRLQRLEQVMLRVRECRSVS